MTEIVMNRKKISQEIVAKGPRDAFIITLDYTQFLEGGTIADASVESEGDCIISDVSYSTNSVSFVIDGGTYDQRISVKISTGERTKFCRKIPIEVY